MKNRKTIGLDKWCIHADLSTFLRICSRKNLMIYEVSEHHDIITFYSSVFQRHDVQRTFESIDYIKTTGMIGFLLRTLRNPMRMTCMIISIICWYVLSNTIFEIQIKGDKQESRQLIKETLKDMDIVTPFYENNMKELKDNLKKTLENDISWLEIVKQGSRYVITYTPKEFADIEELGRDELIAQKDGVIAKFDLSHGNKMCKLNDFVHAGDILVSNILIDSMNKEEELFVKGKVYAYTWRDISVEMEESNLPEAFAFYQLLFEARREVSKDLSEDEKIYKENILQFSTNMGKISMKVHYTLYEDITSP